MNVAHTIVACVDQNTARQKLREVSMSMEARGRFF